MGVRQKVFREALFARIPVLAVRRARKFTEVDTHAVNGRGSAALSPGFGMGGVVASAEGGKICIFPLPTVERTEGGYALSSISFFFFLAWFTRSKSECSRVVQYVGRELKIQHLTCQQ